MGVNHVSRTKEKEFNYQIKFKICNQCEAFMTRTSELSLRLLFELDRLCAGLSSMSPSSLSIENPERCSIICGCANGLVLACCCGVCGWATCFGCAGYLSKNNKKKCMR